MSKIITASGKKYESDYFVPMEDPPMLFLRVLNTTESEIRSVFADTNETSCLRYGNLTAFGYIHLNAIFKEGDAFKVVLLK